jgi:hypothetical protein
MSIQARGILDGSGGAAIAQMLMGQAKPQQQEQDSLFSGKNLPSLIQALSYSKAQESAAAYNIQKAALEKAETDRMLSAQDAINKGGNDNEKTALRHKLSGMDASQSTKLLEDIFGQQANERKAKGLAAWTEGLNAATKEGLSPETAVPLVLQRLMSDKELGPSVAEALGTDIDSLKKATDMGIELVQNGNMAEGSDLIQSTLEQIHYEGKNGDGMSTLLRKPEFLLSRFPKVMTEVAIKKSHETPPPEGMSQEQWTAKWVNTANMVSKHMTDASGKPQKGMDLIKAIVGVSNSASEQFFKQQNADIDREQNAITRRGQDLDYQVGMAGVAARRAAIAAHAKSSSGGNWGVTPGVDDNYDLNRNGVIDKGKEQALWKTDHGASVYDTGEDTNTTEAAPAFIIRGGRVVGTQSGKSTSKNKNRERAVDAYTHPATNVGGDRKSRIDAARARFGGVKKK